MAWGGRGAAKSWNFARALLIQSLDKPFRNLCARETQKSIKDSVHRLLADQIELLNLQKFYRVQASEIVGRNGSLFSFAGIRQNISNVKSFEGYDRVWVEEAVNVSKNSWGVLIPTIRKDGSEIWVSFNAELESDETYKRFVVDPPADAHVVKINWFDNPWFPPVLRKEMDELRRKDPSACDHIYEGVCRQAVEGAIYANELNALAKEGREMRVPYDPQYPVHTFWDLGFADSTAIWFAQSIGFEFRIIDYLDGELQALQFYLKELQNRGYVYGTDYLPHDARAHELGTGRSIEEQMRAAGRKVRIVKKLSVEDGIAAARVIFPKCYFDREKCSDGLQSLRHYRYEQDVATGTFKREPLHDWASHGADAWRTLAVAIKDNRKSEDSESKQPVGSFSGSSTTSGTGWMR